ncbi:MAG: hypothetical protein V4580_15360 [Bacteroidota bacterium]
MKYFWIFLTFLIVTPGFSQSDTSRLYQAYPSFLNPEKAEWTAFENNWNYVEYSALKKNNKIKGLNCKNCESFYADMYIEINEAGEIAAVLFLKGKICGQPIQNSKLSAEFENSINSRTFKSLKNRRFIARFGNSLKC